MNRDAIFATLIGFGIGLLITGGFLLGPTIIRSLPQVTFPKFSFSGNKSKTSPTPTQQPESTGLSIHSPLPDTIEDKDEILVSGTTSSNAVIVLVGPNGEIVVSADNDGKYAGKITLVEGKNDITVTSYKDTEEQSQEVTVFYTPEKL